MTPVPDPVVEVFGIRHHGPGSARALRRALEDFGPDVVLIEGPPEADALVPLAADPGMTPPVALLAYTVDPTPSDATGASTSNAAFWPFADFSPEWQALRHALKTGAPTRFFDLPATHLLATPAATSTPTGEDTNTDTNKTANDNTDAGSNTATGTSANTGSSTPTGTSTHAGENATASVDTDAGDAAGATRSTTAGDSARAGSNTATGTSIHAGENANAGAGGNAGDGADGDVASGAGAGGGEPSVVRGEGAARAVRFDPLAWLAEAAGYDDAERWWDDVVEHREGGPSPFPAIAEAMGELRTRLAELPAEEVAAGLPPGYLTREEQREAHMRRVLRKTKREGFTRIAVVCGAWHVPAVLARVPVAEDDRVLRGLPKTKVAMTWVPWTHGRLAEGSGYGAGVRSPGWYAHLFAAADRPVERWLTEAARVLRDEDLHVSSAHVIEAVRLAETLAVLRGRPLAGLDEVTEATLAVLCEGDEVPLALVQRRMLLGERLGAVPDATPMVPLQRDLQAAQRRLRLKPSALVKEHEFDLRRPNDRERSRLLHRLRLLGVGWGVPAADAVRSKGTFRETWTLEWRPELDVELIEAGVWGVTVAEAATARAKARARDAGTLADLTALAEQCLLADLGGALAEVMRAVADRAAVDADVAHLMSALPALVRSLRYGDVRGTATGPLRTVVDGLVVRICVGLPPAVTTLDDDAARALLAHTDDVHGALALLDDDAHRDRWFTTLHGLADRDSLHGLLSGRFTRLLLDAGRPQDTPARMARAVSVGAPPSRAAAWVEGFLAGGGLVLVHDADLLALLDAWVTDLPPATFTDVLPLLRRTFGTFGTAERRSIGDRLRSPAPTARPAPVNAPDPALAEPAVATALHLLGWKVPT
ncbi:DUF5682 family protein [Actinomadura flavalba]|uniref:DUF5682 family protein n=1 Tax=Actinomadura flavalba TaxID=1120938 RepID=UPI00035DA09D|nr:DUF5682 family protein [Actinomadura flavalba]